MSCVNIVFSSTVGICLLSWKECVRRLDSKRTKTPLMECKHSPSVTVESVNSGYEPHYYVSIMAAVCGCPLHGAVVCRILMHASQSVIEPITVGSS